jgi:hypothetical protein
MPAAEAGSIPVDMPRPAVAMPRILGYRQVACHEIQPGSPTGSRSEAMEIAARASDEGLGATPNRG